MQPVIPFRKPRKLTADSPEVLEYEANRAAVNMLNHSRRTRAGLRDGLRRREFPDDIIETVLDRLTEVGLVDDFAYARDYANYAGTEKCRSRRRIAEELRSKGVGGSAVSAALESLGEDNDWQAARALAAKKLRSLSAHPYEVKYRRIGGALSRAGFNTSIVLEVLRETLGEALELERD